MEAATTGSARGRICDLVGAGGFPRGLWSRKACCISLPLLTPPRTAFPRCSHGIKSRQCGRTQRLTREHTCYTCGFGLLQLPPQPTQLGSHKLEWGRQPPRATTSSPCPAPCRSRCLARAACVLLVMMRSGGSGPSEAGLERLHERSQRAQGPPQGSRCFLLSLQRQLTHQ